MTPNQVDCFLAVLKHGNITAAAKAMFLSPQVVSQHISQLEKELSVPLFHRRRSPPGPRSAWCPTWGR